MHLLTLLALISVHVLTLLTLISVHVLTLLAFSVPVLALRYILYIRSGD